MAKVSILSDKPPKGSWLDTNIFISCVLTLIQQLTAKLHAACVIPAALAPVCTAVPQESPPFKVKHECSQEHLVLGPQRKFIFYMPCSFRSLLGSESWKLSLAFAFSSFKMYLGVAMWIYLFFWCSQSHWFLKAEWNCIWRIKSPLFMKTSPVSRITGWHFQGEAVWAPAVP